jgi:hypothetical protein
VKEDRARLGVETLRNDAAALFSFVDSVCQQCEERLESPAYPQASRDFFSYIANLGRATKRFLNTFSYKAPQDPRLYIFYRGSLEVIRNGWFEFHQFIKPAVDADTLHIPFSLITALTSRFNDIKELKNTKFAVFHFNELNYLQVRVSAVKETADKLAKRIPDAPTFEPNLGMIGIPYSQASSLFLNCLVAHEMGHFVFQKLNKRAALLSGIAQEIAETFKDHALFLRQDNTWYSDRLAGWSEDFSATFLLSSCWGLVTVSLLSSYLASRPS